MTIVTPKYAKLHYTSHFKHAILNPSIIQEETNMNIESKRLYKSRNNRMLTGVCGGIAEYLNLDPTVVRLLCAILCCSGTGFIIYIVAAVIMPEAPIDYDM